mmetsp:Transcript_20711/g.61247  ORF Transcript_20711/g.61247 Transcript_20711/m.61247 type:complete len:230 (-) Transcript_20711:1160-1849(-)
MRRSSGARASRARARERRRRRRRRSAPSAALGAQPARSCPGGEAAAAAEFPRDRRRLGPRRRRICHPLRRLLRHYAAERGAAEPAVAELLWRQMRRCCRRREEGRAGEGSAVERPKAGRVDAARRGRWVVALRRARRAEPGKSRDGVEEVGDREAGSPLLRAERERAVHARESRTLSYGGGHGEGDAELQVREVVRQLRARAVVEPAVAERPPECAADDGRGRCRGAVR